MRRHTIAPVVTSLVFALVAIPTAAFAAPTNTTKVRPRSTAQLKLQQVKHQGQAFYRTYRVTSSAGLGRIQNKSDGFRFFHGGGQYGEAFYLFTNIKDARRFASCEKARGAGNRNVIAEVLLPKKMVDSVKKAQVKKGLDWAMNRGRNDQVRSKLNDLRLSNHLLFGKWADSPDVKEPFYKSMNGASQIGVVQRGMPSVLHQALIREVEKTK